MNSRKIFYKVVNHTTSPRRVIRTSSATFSIPGFRREISPWLKSSKSLSKRKLWNKPASFMNRNRWRQASQLLYGTSLGSDKVFKQRSSIIRCLRSAHWPIWRDLLSKRALMAAWPGRPTTSRSVMPSWVVIWFSATSNGATDSIRSNERSKS